MSRKTCQVKIQAYKIQGTHYLYIIDICCQRYSCCSQLPGGIFRGALPAVWNRTCGVHPSSFVALETGTWADVAGTPQSFPLAPAAHVQRADAALLNCSTAILRGEWFWRSARQILRWHMPTPDAERGWLRLLHRKGTCYWNGAVSDSIWISPEWKGCMGLHGLIQGWHSHSSGWWFQTFGLCSIIYGMSSFPLTVIFFKMGTLHHQPVIITTDRRDGINSAIRTLFCTSLDRWEIVPIPSCSQLTAPAFLARPAPVRYFFLHRNSCGTLGTPSRLPHQIAFFFHKWSQKKKTQNLRGLAHQNLQSLEKNRHDSPSRRRRGWNAPWLFWLLGWAVFQRATRPKIRKRFRTRNAEKM